MSNSIIFKNNRTLWCKRFDSVFRTAKENETDKIWWLDTDDVGNLEFSFDKVKVFNLFRDYPYKLTDEQVQIFNEENPYWATFFKDRLT